LKGIDGITIPLDTLVRAELACCGWKPITNRSQPDGIGRIGGEIWRLRGAVEATLKKTQIVVSMTR
jgi:hypothetical protein